LAATRNLDDDELGRIEDALGRLYNLPQYQFIALELISSVDIATIAEVFVRINGQGKKLNQSDFILTLMSVFWDEGRSELESFSHRGNVPANGKSSPFNHFIRPTPDQMLRVTIGLALKRARLENVYSALRGVEPKTGIVNATKREHQFNLMRQAQNTSLNLVNWHHFLSALRVAGYRSGRVITSETAIIFSYVLYLIGVHDFKVHRETMRQHIAEFFSWHL
jgi:hypothetical protein